MHRYSCCASCFYSHLDSLCLYLRSWPPCCTHPCGRAALSVQICTIEGHVADAVEASVFSSFLKHSHQLSTVSAELAREKNPKHGMRNSRHASSSPNATYAYFLCCSRNVYRPPAVLHVDVWEVPAQACKQHAQWQELHLPLQITCNGAFSVL